MAAPLTLAPAAPHRTTTRPHLRPPHTRAPVIAAAQERSPAELVSLDLSKRNLAFVDLRAFVALKRLNLADNRMTVKALQAGGLGKLSTLEELDVSNNRLSRLDKLSQLLNGMRKLRSLKVVGNPVYERDSPEIRLRLLSGMGNVGKRRFALEYIESVGVTIDERCRALALARMEESRVERVRCDLTLEEVRARARVCVGVRGGVCVRW